MLWNAGGSLTYLFAQWLVTVLVARFFKDNYGSAGVLSIAMSLSAIFQTVTLFGMRNYQVSDIRGKYTNEAYFGLRHITACVSLLLALFAALVLLYRGETLTAILLYMLFRIVESYSDVLHGMVQKEGRLDLAGRGFALKAAALLAGFLVGYLLTHALIPALFGMLVGSCLTTVLYDLPMARRISPFSLRFSPKAAIPLLGETFPLCIYFFLYSSISSIPKFVLEKLAGEETLGAYASIYAPAVLIAGVANYLYMPFTTSFALFANEGREREFRRLMLRILLVLVALLLCLLAAAFFLGEWALALVFGNSILPFAGLLSPILCATFGLATLSFFCMLAVVRRRFLFLCIAVGTGTLLSFVATLFFIPVFHANGASYGLLAASAVAILLLCIPVLRPGIHQASCRKDS